MHQAKPDLISFNWQWLELEYGELLGNVAKWHLHWFKHFEIELKGGWNFLELNALGYLSTNTCKFVLICFSFVILF